MKITFGTTITLAFLLALGACDEPDSSPGGDAGGAHDGSSNAGAHCGLEPLDVPACGTADGRPFYGYYDGCNWCGCTTGTEGAACTTRACLLDDPFTPDKCQPLYYGAMGVSLPATEDWVCDADGRLYRSGCAPASTTPGIP